MARIWAALQIPASAVPSSNNGAAAARPWWFLPAAAAVLVLQTTLIVNHTYWVDEYQALQIAVQTPNLASLLEQLHYEGHPPGWYLLLRGLAALVGPAHALMAASFLLAGAMQWLILFRSPFGPFTRLCLALGEPILFEFGTISRSYTLGVLLVFLTVHYWTNRRWPWLFLCLLPLVEFFFGAIAALLLVRRGLGRRLWWPGMGLFACTSLFAAWTVLPAPDFVAVFQPTPGLLQGFVTFLHVLSVVAVPLQWSADGPAWNAVPDIFPFAYLWVGFVLVCWEQTRRVLYDRLALFALGGLFLCFFCFVYILGIRHVQLVGVLLVALAWLQQREGIGATKPFRIWLAISAVCGVVAAGAALTVPFDRSDEVADFIEREDLEGERWMAWPAQLAQGVSAQTGIMFESPETGCASDFIRWNFRTNLTTPQEIIPWLEREAGRGRFYLASFTALPDNPVVKEIARFERSFGSAIWVYEVAPDQDGRRPAAPRCVPGMVPLRLRD